METDLIVRLYESRLWRRNPALALLMGITFDQEWEIISQAMRLSGSEAILDLACGTGIYARRIAREASRGLVCGLDLSQPMLKHGKGLVQRSALSNVVLLQGDAIALPFLNRHFDVVNCAGALHLFGDLARTLSEVSRVLKEGGRFTFATFRSRGTRFSERIVRWRRHVSGMNAFRPDDLANELQKVGFDRVQCHHAKGIWLVMSATKAG
jgi:SAM-dependent methyltransferase